MAKVLVATDKPFAKVAVDGIRKIVEGAGFELALLEKYTSEAELLAAVADVDALIVRSDKVTPAVIDAAKQLKIVVRAGAGYDNIDLEACTKRGIVAMNTPGQNSNAVAELAFGLMLYMIRNRWNGTSGSELRGKKLGIQAYGHIGRLMAEIGKGFGMDVYSYTRSDANKRQMAADGVKLVGSVEELYSTCNFVSTHVPAKEDTKKSLNYELLSKMPKGGILVNTARKEIIDEDGLLRLMAEREDIRYISDIEPDKKDEFLKFGDRVLFTAKKMGAQTAEANINAGLAAAEQIVRFLKNGDRTFQVNK